MLPRLSSGTARRKRFRRLEFSGCVTILVTDRSGIVTPDVYMTLLAPLPFVVVVAALVAFAWNCLAPRPLPLLACMFRATGVFLIAALSLIGAFRIEISLGVVLAALYSASAFLSAGLALSCRR